MLLPSSFIWFPLKLSSRFSVSCASQKCIPSSRSHSTLRQSQPLRILFCGSDGFSIASLNALNQEQRLQKSISDVDVGSHAHIESIDVVCRPGKATGRGLKTIRNVPIKSAAEKLNLPVHEIDTFTGWKPPVSINMIIAVSFGLKIPSRILSMAEWGGLNVHPSLLPDFRGAAPIHHAMLHNCEYTGVSVQTLHPTEFDQGEVLLQCTKIPIAANAEPASLVNQLGDIGASLLIRTLREGFYRPSKSREQVFQCTWSGDSSEILSANLLPEKTTKASILRKAPKITKANSNVDWSKWNASKILTHLRVFGSLWDTVTYSTMSLGNRHDTSQSKNEKSKQKRVIFHSLKPLELDFFPNEACDGSPGHIFRYSSENQQQNLGIWAIADKDVTQLQPMQIVSCTIEGRKKGEGVPELRSKIAESQARIGETMPRQP